MEIYDRKPEEIYIQRFVLKRSDDEVARGLDISVEDHIPQHRSGQRICTYTYSLSEENARARHAEAAIGSRVSISENIESNVRDILTSNLAAVISGLAGDRSTVFEIRLVGEDGRIRSGVQQLTPELRAF